MNRYMGWELYEEPPEGFSIDKHTGSPLSGYDFFTNGKSVLNGQKRVLVKANIPANDIAVNHPTSKMQKPKTRVEYNLTEIGCSLMPHIESLVGWALEHMNDILNRRSLQN